MRMSLFSKSLMTLSILLFSSVTVAYESEREYLLDLYYGNDLKTDQLLDQSEQNTEENSLTAESRPGALNVSFPIAGNNSH